MSQGKIKRIEIDVEYRDGVTFFFDDSEQPFDVLEFKPGSLTRKHLERIIYEIQDYNSEVDLRREGF
jgi:hypothetical protein